MQDCSKSFASIWNSFRRLWFNFMLLETALKKSSLLSWARRNLLRKFHSLKKSECTFVALDSLKSFQDSKFILWEFSSCRDLLIPKYSFLQFPLYVLDYLSSKEKSSCSKDASWILESQFSLFRLSNLFNLQLEWQINRMCSLITAEPRRLFEV